MNTCSYLYNMIRSVHVKKDRNEMRVLWKDFSSIFKSASLKIQVLLSSMQIRMEQNSSRILERERDSFKTSSHYEQKPCRCIGGKQSKMEGWKENRQNRLYSYLETNTSLCRLSWIRSRTSPDCGAEYWTYIKAEGGSASY